ncbi:MAG: S24/S26 family peptidase [Eubacteriales bacterium]|nr:S24/S26 family peptidase [Eubacteriales bacterium]
MNEPIQLSDYEELIREVLASGGEFRLYPHGISMLPLLRQGRDSVSLRQVDSPIRKGDILFYQRPDGSFVLHRVRAVTPNGLTMIGDNQNLPERGVSPDWVIGRVTRIFRDDKEVICDGFGYRLYQKLWQFTILRGLLLKLYHLSERRNAK